jgi:hypothetical protein
MKEEPVHIFFPQGNAPYPVKGDHDEQMDHTTFAAFNIAQNIQDMLKQDATLGFETAKAEMLARYKDETGYPDPATLSDKAPTVDRLLARIDNTEELTNFLHLAQPVRKGPQKKLLSYPRWKGSSLFSTRMFAL